MIQQAESLSGPRCSYKQLATYNLQLKLEAERFTESKVNYILCWDQGEPRERKMASDEVRYGAWYNMLVQVWMCKKIYYNHVNWCNFEKHDTVMNETPT